MHICPITVTYFQKVNKSLLIGKVRDAIVVRRRSVRGLVFVIVFVFVFLYWLSHAKVVFAREREAGSGAVGPRWERLAGCQQSAAIACTSRKEIKFYLYFFAQRSSSSSSQTNLQTFGSTMARSPSHERSPSVSIRESKSSSKKSKRRRSRSRSRDERRHKRRHRSRDRHHRR